MTQRTQETQPEPQSQSQDGIDRRLLPWSHRLPVWARFLVDLLAGAVVGVIGTMAHRMGASANIPYGLVIAYALAIISTWSARSRDGVSGLALHLISSSLVVWTVMAGYGPGGDAMIPVGFGDVAVFQQQRRLFLAIRRGVDSIDHAGAAQKLVHDADAH